MDLFLVQKIAVARLQQRCIPLADGDLLFRPRHGDGAIRLSSSQWDDLGRQFHRAVAPSARLLRWAIWLQIPFALAALLLVLRVPGIVTAWDQLDGVAPGLALALMTTWPVIAGAAWHYRQLARALTAIERELAQRPRVSLPSRPERTVSNALEIAAILFIGPHLLIHLYGTLWPEAFDNTPWTGTRLGLADSVGFAVLLLLTLRRRGQASFEGEPLAAAAAEGPAR